MSVDVSNNGLLFGYTAEQPTTCYLPAHEWVLMDINLKTSSLGHILCKRSVSPGQSLVSMPNNLLLGITSSQGKNEVCLLRDKASYYKMRENLMHRLSSNMHENCFFYKVMVYGYTLLSLFCVSYIYSTHI